MKVDYDKNSKFFQAFICHVISPLFTAGAPKVDPQNLEIVCTINGVEVDIVSFIARLEKSMDEQVETRAKELVKERFYEQMESFYDGVRDIEQRLRGLVKEKLPLSRNDDY
jgi:hypothetical protein